MGAGVKGLDSSGGSSCSGGGRGLGLGICAGDGCIGGMMSCGKGIGVCPGADLIGCAIKESIVMLLMNRRMINISLTRILNLSSPITKQS